MACRNKVDLSADRFGGEPDLSGLDYTGNFSIQSRNDLLFCSNQTRHDVTQFFLTWVI